MEKNVKKKPFFALAVLLFILTGAVTYAAGYLKGLDTTHLISYTVLILMGTFAVLFLHAFSRDKQLYDYNNEEHFGRFLFLWILSLAIIVACLYLPVAGWPFLVIYLWFALFSNIIIGITSGSVFVLMAVLLTGESVPVFVLYFTCGIICASLFYKLDQNYKIFIPLLVSVMCLFMGLTAGVVLYENRKLDLELFIIPFINVVVSLILMLAVLKSFSSVIIYRYRGKYLEINDQEFPLQIQLKSEHRNKYYQSIHTAYFCDRIASKLKLNAEAAKASGYYFHISALKGNENWEETKLICEEYEFPPEVHKILQEALDGKTPISSKEAAVLILSESVISAILYMFEKHLDTKPDYDQVVDAVFKSKLKSGVFSKCCLTLEEIAVMEKVFKEEKLYYDFLR